MEYGIPQAMMLGAVLSNMYINEISKLNSTGLIIGFADDVANFYNNENWTVLKAEVENSFTLLKVEI